MKKFTSQALLACAVAAMLAGCSGAAPSSPVGFAGSGGVGSDGRRIFEHPIPFAGLRMVRLHRDHHKTWLSSQVKANRVRRELWISDFGTYDVYIYALPSLALQGSITGFNGPQGMCSDNLGHVWVTNTYSFTILEYSHTGTLLNTLNDPNGWPVSCAWDKRTGNLAVTNIVNFVSGHSGSQIQGAVLVYPGATGTPSAYADPNMFYYYSDGYDNNGNLFVDGEAYDYPYYPFVLGELPSAGSSISTINVTGGTIYAPGGVQWNLGANNLIVGDQECGGNALANASCTYAVSISGSTGTIAGTTALDNSSGTPACDVVQTVRMSNFIYGGDIELTSSPYLACASGGPPAVVSTVYRWLYPAGGNPGRGSTNTISEPDGAAVSK